MTDPVDLIRIQAKVHYPEGGCTILLERKPARRRTYETLHILQTTTAVADAEAVAFLEEVSEVLHELLGRCGYGQGFLDLFGDAPY